MNGPAVEFSRLVPLVRIGREPVRREIAATPEEREKLARRFGLIALDRLTASVELQRLADDAVLLEAAFEAAVVQECVVSLEPVPGTVAERFRLHYGPASADPEIAFEPDAPAFEPLPGEAIDIGEAVAQELSLALPEFPRDPEALLAETAAQAEPGPFAGLVRPGKPSGE